MPKPGRPAEGPAILQNEAGRFICRICHFKTFSLRGGVQRHEKTGCVVTFPTAKRLAKRAPKQPRAEFPRNKNGAYVCRLHCSKEFNTISLIIAHEKGCLTARNPSKNQAGRLWHGKAMTTGHAEVSITTSDDPQNEEGTLYETQPSDIVQAKVCMTTRKLPQSEDENLSRMKNTAESDFVGGQAQSPTIGGPLDTTVAGHGAQFYETSSQSNDHHAMRDITSTHEKALTTTPTYPQNEEGRFICRLGCIQTFNEHKTVERHEKKTCVIKFPEKQRNIFPQNEDGRFLCRLGCTATLATSRGIQAHERKRCMIKFPEKGRKARRDKFELGNPQNEEGMFLCRLGCTAIFTEPSCVRRHEKAACIIKFPRKPRGHNKNDFKDDSEVNLDNDEEDSVDNSLNNSVKDDVIPAEHSIATNPPDMAEGLFAFSRAGSMLTSDSNLEKCPIDISSNVITMSGPADDDEDEDDNRDDEYKKKDLSNMTMKDRNGKYICYFGCLKTFNSPNSCRQHEKLRCAVRFPEKKLKWKEYPQDKIGRYICRLGCGISFIKRASIPAHEEECCTIDLRLHLMNDKHGECQYECGQSLLNPYKRRQHEHSCKANSKQQPKLNLAVMTIGQMAESIDDSVHNDLSIAFDDHSVASNLSDYSLMDENPSETFDDILLNKNLLENANDSLIDENMSNSSGDPPYSSLDQFHKYPATRKRKRSDGYPSSSISQSHKCNVCEKFLDSKAEMDRHCVNRQSLCKPYLGRTLNPLDLGLSFTEWYNLMILAPWKSYGTVHNNVVNDGTDQVSDVLVQAYVLLN